MTSQWASAQDDQRGDTGSTICHPVLLKQVKGEQVSQRRERVAGREGVKAKPLAQETPWIAREVGCWVGWSQGREVGRSRNVLGEGRGLQSPSSQHK